MLTDRNDQHANMPLIHALPSKSDAKDIIGIRASTWLIFPGVLGLALKLQSNHLFNTKPDIWRKV